MVSTSVNVCQPPSLQLLLRLLKAKSIMDYATGVVDVFEGSSKSRSPNLFLHHSVLGKLGVFQAHCYRPTVSSFPIVCSIFIQVTCHTNLANMPCLQKFRRPFCLEHCHSYSTWPLPGSVVADTCERTHAILESNNVHANLLNIHFFQSIFEKSNSCHLV